MGTTAPPGVVSTPLVLDPVVVAVVVVDVAVVDVGAADVVVCSTVVVLVVVESLPQADNAIASAPTMASETKLVANRRMKPSLVVIERIL